MGVRGKPSDFAFVIPREVSSITTVYKPNGELLLAVYPGAIGDEAKARAMPFLLGAHSMYVKADGTVSNTTQTPPIRTSIHGFFDRTPRFPFCRMTAMVSREPEAWAEVLPFLGQVASVFLAGARKRYDAQAAASAKTHPAYVIAGTPFTTLTVNGSIAGAYHRDAGDFKPGFGCMAVFRKGDYSGCLLGFPAFGVAADLDDRSVILFDPHEIHGNTPLVGEGTPQVDFERISVVCYHRAKMSECLSPEDELARVKAARGALPEEA